MTKPRVLYVLGLAYSGSTLFGLSLGQHEHVTNLGEVTNLEHDYRPKGPCSCGAVLEDCRFWTRLRSTLEEAQRDQPEARRWNLSGSGVRSMLEQRKSVLRRLPVLLGAPPDYVLGKSGVADYLAKQEALFEAVATLGKTQVTIDLSKSHERLEILRRSTRLDLRVVYLRRDPRHLLHSNLKRGKRTRSHIRPKLLRELVLLRQRIRGCMRLVEAIGAERTRVVDWESLSREPERVLGEISEWLELKPQQAQFQRSIEIPTRGQHVFVGNRWLFRGPDRPVTIRPFGPLPSLAKVEQFGLRCMLATL